MTRSPPGSTGNASGFGGSLREAFLLEPGLAYVNHGSFGATPRAVLDAQAVWRERMERNPGRFMRDEAPAALDTARASLAGHIGAARDDLVLVDNATAACNAVLRSLRLEPGDEILSTRHGYHAVRQTIRFVAERSGARATEVALPFPETGADAIVEAIGAALGERTRLLVIDHITSQTALVLPVAEIAARARAVGAAVLVDGAHAPGMLALDIPALGVDWYAGNCHKWLCAPRGAGFLWAAPARQDDLHPPVISHFLGEGLQAEFAWQGTRDPSAWLSVPAAIEFHNRLGAAAIRDYCSGLIGEAAALLSDRWRVSAGTPAAMRGFMASLPVPHAPAPDAGAALRRALLAEHAIEANFVPIDGRLWLRVSAFLYNERRDYERVAARVPDIAARFAP